MGHLFFLIKTVVVTVAVLAIMQIPVDRGETLEDYLLKKSQQTTVYQFFQEVAQGGVRWVRKWSSGEEKALPISIIKEKPRWSSLVKPLQRSQRYLAEEATKRGKALKEMAEKALVKDGKAEEESPSEDEDY